MTICMENSRLKMRLIDDKDMLNKVLILTFYFSLLGNNAATLREFHYLWHNGHGCIVRQKHPLQQVICVPLSSQEFGSASFCQFRVPERQSHFNNILFFDGLVTLFQLFSAFYFVTIYNFLGFTNFSFRDLYL